MPTVSSVIILIMNKTTLYLCIHKPLTNNIYASAFLKKLAMRILIPAGTLIEVQPYICFHMYGKILFEVAYVPYLLIF